MNDLERFINNNQIDINVVQATLDKISDRGDIISTYCNKISSFKNFTTTYFPELFSRQR